MRSIAARMRTRGVLLVGVLAGGLALVAPANGAVREVPQDFDTIQLAVDAANPGDTIAVSKKRNFEHVSVSTPNLAIRGVRKGVVVDGYIEGTGDGEQFDIAANGVRIVNLELRHGSGIYCASSDRCAAKKVRWTGASNSYCFYSTGDQARVLSSKMRSCGSEGISAGGDDAVIKNNRIRNTDSGCIDVGGEDALIAGNRMAGCEDSDGISVNDDGAEIRDNYIQGVDGELVDVSGDGARVIGNRGSGAYYACFYVSGDGAQIRNNVGSSCDDGGIDVSGDNPKVKGNRIANVNDYGIYVSCSTACGGTKVEENSVRRTVEDDSGIYLSVTSGTGSVLVARNTVVEASDYGIDLGGLDDSRIVRNTVRATANEQEPGFYVGGDDNVLRKNRALGNGGDGFDISGSDNRFEENVANGNHGDGFENDGTGNILHDNVANLNKADGFENDGTNTVLRRNRAAGNRRDCANDGSFVIRRKNKCADGSNFSKPGTASRVRRR